MSLLPIAGSAEHALMRGAEGIRKTICDVGPTSGGEAASPQSGPRPVGIGETEDRHNEGLADNNLGLVLHRAGRFDEAITAYERAVTIFREIGHQPAQSMTLANLAASLKEANRHGEADTASRAAEAILRDIGSGQQGLRTDEPEGSGPVGS